jgi:hypothetical protein
VGIWQDEENVGNRGKERREKDAVGGKGKKRIEDMARMGMAERAAQIGQKKGPLWKQKAV